MSDILIYKLFEAVTVIFEVLIVQQYISGFFGLSTKARYVLGGYSLFCIGLVFLSLFFRHPIILAGYTVFGILAIEFFFYSGNKNIKFFSAFFFVVLMIGVDIICAGALTSLGDINLKPLHEYSLRRAIYIVIVKTVQVFIVKIFGIIVKRKINNNNEIELKGVFGLLFCQIISIVLLSTIFMTAYHSSDTLSISMLLSISGIMYINFVVFWYFDRIKAAYEYKHEKELAETKLEFQREYYELLEERQQETEALLHDMKKHISAIKELYRNNLKIDTEDYINEFDRNINAIPKVVRTSLPAINAILLDGLRKAKKENIEVRLDINISDKLKINTFDLCVILGNTIENAINACYILPNGVERFIDVSLLQNDSLILVDIKNPFSDTNKTMPKDGKKHGYGMKNVYKVVKKYGGDIEVTTENNIFHVSIIIP